jgi:hypothetical protein
MFVRHGLGDVHIEESFDQGVKNFEIQRPYFKRIGKILSVSLIFVFQSMAINFSLST